MAAGGESPFKDLIECRICMELMGPDKKPKLLPCRHTVCEHCIDRLQQVMCPLCKKQFSQNSSEDLPTNVTLLQLIDVTVDKNNASNKKLCEYCSDEARPISHVCKDCDEYFCFDCAKKHPEMFKCHHVIECSASSTCTMHQRTFTMFCMDCNILLCRICAHNKTCCSNENKKYIEHIKSEKAQDLKKIINKLSSEIQFREEAKLSNANTLNSAMTNIADVRLQITTHTQMLQEKLKQREKEMIDALNEYENELINMQMSIDSDLN